MLKCLKQARTMSQTQRVTMVANSPPIQIPTLKRLPLCSSLSQVDLHTISSKWRRRALHSRKSMDSAIKVVAIRTLAVPTWWARDRWVAQIQVPLCHPKRKEALMVPLTTQSMATIDKGRCLTTDIKASPSMARTRQLTQTILEWSTSRLSKTWRNQPLSMSMSSSRTQEVPSSLGSRVAMWARVTHLAKTRQLTIKPQVQETRMALMDKSSPSRCRIRRIPTIRVISYSISQSLTLRAKAKMRRRLMRLVSNCWNRSVISHQVDLTKAPSITVIPKMAANWQSSLLPLALLTRV